MIYPFTHLIELPTAICLQRMPLEGYSFNYHGLYYLFNFLQISPAKDEFSTHCVHGKELYFCNINIKHFRE
jgi:hypothetical protein